MTLIPLILPISNAISMFLIDKANTLDKSVGTFYGLMLVLALFFNFGLVNLSRNYLYRFLPYTLIWIMLSLVYFLGPVMYAGYTVRRLNHNEDYQKQASSFVAYFSLVYLLLHIRVTSNWQVIESCARGY
jgi:hypothetical protein